MAINSMQLVNHYPDRSCRLGEYVLRLEVSANGASAPTATPVHPDITYTHTGAAADLTITFAEKSKPLAIHGFKWSTKTATDQDKEFIFDSYTPSTGVLVLKAKTISTGVALVDADIDGFLELACTRSDKS